LRRSLASSMGLIMDEGHQAHQATRASQGLIVHPYHERAWWESMVSRYLLAVVGMELSLLVAMLQASQGPYILRRKSYDLKRGTRVSIEDLPNDLLRIVASYLGGEDLARFCCTR